MTEALVREVLNHIRAGERADSNTLCVHTSNLIDYLHGRMYEVRQNGFYVY